MNAAIKNQLITLVVRPDLVPLSLNPITFVGNPPLNDRA